LKKPTDASQTPHITREGTRKGNVSEHMVLENGWVVSRRQGKFGKEGQGKKKPAKGGGWDENGEKKKNL